MKLAKEMNYKTPASAAASYSAQKRKLLLLGVGQDGSGTAGPKKTKEAKAPKNAETNGGVRKTRGRKPKPKVDEVGEESEKPMEEK